MRRFSPRFVLLCTLSLLSACAGGDSAAGPTAPPPPPPPVAAPIPPGVLSLSVAGLPTGTSADIAVAGAAFTRAAAGTVSWVDVPAGQYTITVRPVRTAEGTFTATPATVTVTVVSGSTPAIAAITYAPLPSALDLTISGVPGGVDPPVTVSAPGGDGVAVTASRVLTSANAGRWKVAAGTLLSGGFRYAPSPAAVDTLVLAGDTTRVAVRYDLASGALAVALTGLPAGLAGAVQVTGPQGFTKTVTATATLTELTPGAYQVIAAAVSAGGITYRPRADTIRVTVAASLTAAPAPVAYLAQVGRVVVTTSGLPAGAAPAMTLTLTGSNVVRTLSGPAAFDSLPVGSYALSASPLTVAGVRYLPATAIQNLAATVGNTTTINVAFAAVPIVGSIAVGVGALPTGITPTFTLTGTGAPRSASGAGTVSSLEVGNWTVTANAIVSGTTTYTPSPSSQSVAVTENATATVSFSYTAVVAANYAITNVYLTQAIQRLDNSVALVAGRDALLRVFVRANTANTARPDVRVRLYDGASLLQTATIAAPEPSVRTALAEGTLTSTWNLLVPGANVRPTTRVLVDLDPARAITDADRSDNTWPASGTPQSVSVNTVPPFTVRFVPIVVGALTGNVTAGNQTSFLSSVQRMFPLNTVASDVRAPFTSSATDIQSNDGNGQWLTVLSEINALRTTDGAPATTHYYGVLKVAYTSGVAGYGYVPGRAAVGWDHLPSGDRVAAHEWGHNFSRNHAPCGTTGDASYPYADGVINHWGWNRLTNTLVSPTATDVMGYCGNQWISDYNWSAVMQYRSASGGISSPAAPGEGLLVWGRVVNGQILLEPAFRVNAPVSADATSASHRLELLDADGATLLDTPIVAQQVDHATATDERQFAVVVPWSTTLEARLAAIRVRDARSPLAAVARRSARMTAPVAGGTPVAPPTPVQAQIDRTTDGRARVTWNTSAYPMAMVQDASTGALMGFVRHSGDAVVTGGRAVDVIFSDGVRSVRR